MRIETFEQLLNFGAGRQFTVSKAHQRQAQNRCNKFKLMKRVFLAVLILAILNSCGKNDCPSGINTLPMYGGAVKCAEQLQIDSDFLEECDKKFESIEVAAIHHVDLAWGYFYKDQLDKAMTRLNQAWLLDSLNADIYWGYGNVLGKQQKFEESVKYLEKSLKMNPENPKVWISASTSYGQLFYRSKDVDQLNRTIDYLKKSISLDPTNAQAFAQLTASYTYFTQTDSARKYLAIADQLDPSAVNPEVRAILNKK